MTQFVYHACREVPVLVRALAASLLFAVTAWASPGSQVVPADASPTSQLAPTSIVRELGSERRGASCATRRKRYAQSEACFARFRMKNRGLRPGAFKHCKQMKDPAGDCGSGGMLSR
jgi:hypothetical protein